MVFKISVDQNKCIGCGACANTCSNFKMVDGKSKPIKSTVAAPGCNEEAKALCPTHAITVKKV